MKRPYGSLLLLIFPVLSFGHEDAIKEGRVFAAGLLAEAKLPGLSIAVSVGDSIVWSEGFGFADVQRKIPVTPSTRFRIGSVTKLLTAAVAARLYEQGRLDLDAPVQRYVSSSPDMGKPITSRQLLGHISGIRHYNRSEFFN